MILLSWHPGFPMTDENHEEALKSSFLKRIKEIFSEEEIRVICKVCPPTVRINLERDEMDRMRELGAEVEYSGRLVSKLGFDLDTGELNTKTFPITKEDKQMDQIKNQFLNYNRAVDKYDQYLQDLLKKYGVNPRSNYVFYHFPVTKQDLLEFGLDI